MLPEFDGKYCNYSLRAISSFLLQTKQIKTILASYLFSNTILTLHFSVLYIAIPALNTCVINSALVP